MHARAHTQHAHSFLGRVFSRPVLPRCTRYVKRSISSFAFACLCLAYASRAKLITNSSPRDPGFDALLAALFVARFTKAPHPFSCTPACSLTAPCACPCPRFPGRNKHVKLESLGRRRHFHPAVDQQRENTHRHTGNTDSRGSTTRKHTPTY